MRLIFVLLFLSIKLVLHAQGPGNLTGQNINFNSKNIIRVPGIISESSILAGLNSSQTFQQVTYYSDLGKPLQKVIVQGSPNGKDIIQPFLYDYLGRESTKYLPITLFNLTGQSSNGTDGKFETGVLNSDYPSSLHYQFYQQGGDLPKDINPFSTTVFEHSPLNRVVTQGSVGASWQPGVAGGYKTFSYNGANGVRKWTVDSNGLLISPGFYSAQTVTSVLTTDEMNSQTLMLSDSRGQKISTWVNVNNASEYNWAETYYVFDDDGKLLFVLPPQFIRQYPTSGSGSYNPAAADVDKWCYQFKYDVLGRVTQSKVPGADWKYVVYDSRDRAVLTQDGVQRQNNDWSYIKYDQLNRPVVSGVYHAGSPITLSSMQTTIDGINAGAGYQNITLVKTVGIQTGVDIVLNEYNGSLGDDVEASHSVSLEPGFSFTAGVNSLSFHATVNTALGAGGKPSDVFPTGNIEDLVYTYYDSYANCEGCSTHSSDYDFNFFSSIQWNSSTDEPFINTSRVNGKTVGSKVKILGTDNWLYTVVYYNRKGQVIQTIGDNHWGSFDISSYLYNFQGQCIEKLDPTFRTINTYDAIGNLITVDHQIGSQPKETIAQLTYNELGQLTSKKFHRLAPNSSNFMQSIDYRYNIQGWLTNINNIPEGDDPSDFFGLDMAFNTNISGNATRTDGLISAVRWKQDLGLKRRVYNYSYDEFGRVNAANHKMSTDQGVTWNGEVDFFSELGISYDLNGNIRSLSRNKEIFNGTTNAPDQIDQLNYVYGNTPMNFFDGGPDNGNNGNQLQYVQELSSSANKQLGFSDGGSNSISGTTPDPDYLYDLNGNVIKDQNKQIANISYYFNNLPNQITFNDGSSLKYVYDAAGIKLSQLYNLPGSSKAGTLLDSLDFSSTFSPFVSDAGSTLSLSNGQLKVGGVNTNQSAYISLNTIPGHNYYISFDIDLNGSGTITAHANDLTSDLALMTITSNGTYTYRFTATTGSLILFTNAAASARDFYLDNVVIKDQAIVTDYRNGSIYIQGVLQSINIPGGRITPPTYANLFANPDAGSLEGYTANQNVTVATNYSNSQTYVKAVCNQSTSTPGIFPINTTKGSSFAVNAGESYTFQVLGYQSSGSSASLYVQSGTGTIISSSITLPVQNANGTNENWASVNFTVPNGVTSIQLGVLWTVPATGNTFYINRVALYKTNLEYNYFITDQVGSTRVVLQTTPGTRVYTATMEPQNQLVESSKFLNMGSSQSGLMVASPGNHTPGGSYAYKLNGATPVGPAKSIKVYPGDKIDASAYSFFVNSSGYNSTLASVAGNVISTFGGGAGLGDPGSIYQNVTNIYAPNGLLAGHTGSTTYPSAYLNYILFDKDYNPLQGQSFPISQTANSVQSLSMTTVTALELGYIYIYLSYENTNTNPGAEVYFDDFKITVQESAVIQVNNYYPFGMESYTWLREGETDNAYLFQGKELIAQTGWHDFGSRMYYADLGRWFATDPQNQFSSPYLAMGNMPMMGQDPNGEWFGIDDIVASVVGAISNVISHLDDITKHGWDWSKFGAAFASGAVGGEVTLYAGPEAGFIAAGGLQNYFNNGGNFNHWDWKEFVNAGMSAFGAGDAGLEAAEKQGFKKAESELFEKAESRASGVFSKLGLTKELFEAKTAKGFKYGDYIKDGLKGGRDAILNSFKDSKGNFDGWDVVRNFGYGFASSSLGKIGAREINNKFTRSLVNKYIQTFTYQFASSMSTGEDMDLKDVLGDGLNSAISTYGGRLLGIYAVIARATFPFGQKPSSLPLNEPTPGTVGWYNN